MPTDPSSANRILTGALAAASTLALCAAAPAPAAAAEPQLELVERAGQRFQRSITAHAERQAALERRIERAEAEPDFGLAPGVSLATLEAIAACESGGDPRAVNPEGYYGKYQFDAGTWAAVGGSGNAAEASESEQDYRASLLYSRAGSSPWPLCGA